MQWIATLSQNGLGENRFHEVPPFKHNWNKYSYRQFRFICFLLFRFALSGSSLFFWRGIPRQSHQPLQDLSEGSLSDDLVRQDPAIAVVAGGEPSK